MRKITRHDVDVFFAISAALSDLPAVQARLKELSEREESARTAVEELHTREAAFAGREADIAAREATASEHEARIAQRETEATRTYEQRIGTLASGQRELDTAKGEFAKEQETGRFQISAQLEKQATRAAEFETEMAAEREALAAQRAAFSIEVETLAIRAKELEAESQRLEQRANDLKAREAAYLNKVEKLDQLAPKFRELLS